MTNHQKAITMTMTDDQLAQIVRSFRSSLAGPELHMSFERLHEEFDPNELLDQCAFAVLGDYGHGEPAFAILNRCAGAITALNTLAADIAANVADGETDPFYALRVERAATLAEQYAHDTGLDIADEPFTVVTDIVADLLHFLASTGETNPISAAARGIDHFTEES